MSLLVEYSSWNFENKQLLLQAELHYLDGRFNMAEMTYKASILSAHEHKFYCEEALAHELFGVYLVENEKFAQGVEQLKHAQDKYKNIGALRKAGDVQDFIELIELGG